MADELPKQKLLIKLMGMTGSANDGEALVALRKATQLLNDAGWTWERLIEGKIKVVENPFAGVGFARFERKPVTPQAPASPPPQSTYVPNFFASPATPLSKIRNKFAGHCYCCGTEVIAQAGWLFDPWTLMSKAQSKWQVACTACNTNGVVTSHAATPKKNPRKASITDLA